MTKRNHFTKFWCILLTLMFLLSAYTPVYAEIIKPPVEFSTSDIPEYTDAPYIEINNNTPYFTSDEITTNSFEIYSDLDESGRCQTAFACLGPETLPTEKRGEIGSVKPSGWHTVKYPEYISDLYLYNRCHLIAYELSAENANEKNLTTGTRYMNISGMLPFENKTADYIKETNNHVMYRVTPVFQNDELVCRGILMEAYSVEDNGAGLSFCVYCYNVQPNIDIDYATGDSWVNTTNTNSVNTFDTQTTDKTTTYIININTKVFHYPDCTSVTKMKETNKQEYTCNRNDLIADGYKSCKKCNP